MLVLAHGIGAQKDVGLGGWGERFAAAGIAAVVFDYRRARRAAAAAPCQCCARPARRPPARWAGCKGGCPPSPLPP